MPVEGHDAVTMIDVDTFTDSSSDRTSAAVLSGIGCSTFRRINIRSVIIGNIQRIMDRSSRTKNIISLTKMSSNVYYMATVTIATIIATITLGRLSKFPRIYIRLGVNLIFFTDNFSVLDMGWSHDFKM